MDYLFAEIQTANYKPVVPLVLDPPGEEDDEENIEDDDSRGRNKSEECRGYKKRKQG